MKAARKPVINAVRAAAMRCPSAVKNPSATLNSFAGKWALITGASSGLGLEFADLLAARKINLVLAARRQEPMETLTSDLRRK